MKKIFSIILPLLLLGGGITLAFNVVDESPCTSETTRGYTKTNPANPDPSTPPGTEISNGNLQDVGIYEVNFECANSTQECHWVYSPESPEANVNGWIRCEGDFEEL